MKRMFMKRFLPILIMVVSFVIPDGVLLRDAHAAASSQAIYAFFLNNVPTEYDSLEKLFASFKNSGANTIIVKPADEKGAIPKKLLANEVFLAHQAGFKLFVVLPTRSRASVLAQHADWEDMRYDLANGSVQSNGKIDLFRPEAVASLAEFSKEIASYSVDGILLGDDFFYSETDGMSPAAREVFKQKVGARLVPGDFFPKTAENERALELDNLGDAFWKWTDLKKNALVESYLEVVKAARSVNPVVKVGIPLHAEGLITSREELGRYACSMDSYRKLDADYFWISIPHREIRARLDMNYTKSMELLSRIAMSVANLTKEPERTLIVVQTTEPAGKTLPLSEIEEATEMVKHANDPGIAFLVGADSALPPVLTRKTFRR